MQLFFKLCFRAKCNLMPKMYIVVIWLSSYSSFFFRFTFQCFSSIFYYIIICVFIITIMYIIITLFQVYLLQRIKTANEIWWYKELFFKLCFRSKCNLMPKMYIVVIWLSSYSSFFFLFIFQCFFFSLFLILSKCHSDMTLIQDY